METFWSHDQLNVVNDVLESGRAGHPRLLVVTGEPGVGKTSLLAQLVASAQDYVVLSAEGVQGPRAPYEVLAQCGAHVEATDGVLPSPFIAAQSLRDLLDRHQSRGPVLLKVDDLQWADAESVEALTWVLRRIGGDRLVVAVGTRGLPLDTHEGWQRYVAQSSNTQHIDLRGMSAETARHLTRTRHPELSDTVATRLWEHTSGNPLYLTSLMDEYDSAQLRELDALPAPSTFAQAVRARLARLPESCSTLLRALSVLGFGWSTVADSTAVAAIDNPSEVADLLHAAGLVEINVSQGQSVMRPAHSMISAAVYQQMRIGTRRGLHLAAAGIAESEEAALRHRVAAAEQYDHHLAEDLHRFADQLHRNQSHRQAAQYFRWASSVTADPTLRRRRWFESLIDGTLAGDVDRVEQAVTDLDPGTDPHLAAVVRGLLSVRCGNWDDTIAILQPVISSPTSMGDALTRYRANVLVAWAGVCTGVPTTAVNDWLAAAESTGAQDEALSAFALFARGQALAREVGPGPLLLQLSDLPDRSASVPVASTYLLSWRGALRAHLGLHGLAREDMIEAQRRIQAGVTDVLDGGFHGFLAQIYWFTGEWDFSKLCFRLAHELAGHFLLPLVLTYEPLLAIGLGDLERADAQIADATQQLDAKPWPEAVQSLLIARVVRAHADPSTRQNELWQDMATRWPHVSFVSGLVGPTYFVHAALAALWASDTSALRLLLANLDASQPQAPWVPGVVWWLRGLQAEAEHQPQAALAALQHAIAAPLSDLPLYEAHIHVDFARLAHPLGHTEQARESLQRALAIYSRLGAHEYSERAQRLLTWANEPPPVRRPAGLLSERERDVLALVATGMSYAQVAKELFITQSTVSYHLSNMYAKAGVSSRHQLTALARTDPSMLGLVSAPAH